MSDYRDENLKIAQILEQHIKMYPQMRFGQIMVMLSVVVANNDDLSKPSWKDEFYTEPSDLLARIKTEMKKIQGRV